MSLPRATVRELDGTDVHSLSDVGLVEFTTLRVVAVGAA